MNFTTKRRNVRNALFGGATLVSMLAGMIFIDSAVAQKSSSTNNSKTEFKLEKNKEAVSLGAPTNSFLISQSGGNGGRNFRIKNGNDNQITGITIFAGNVVDGIKVKYSSGTELKTGGFGGYTCPVRINSNEYIKTMKVKHGNVVDSVAFGLARKGTDKIINWTRCGGRGGNRESTYTAPKGEAIVGFHGKSANLIDSIGAIYGSIPR